MSGVAIRCLRKAVPSAGLLPMQPHTGRSELSEGGHFCRGGPAPHPGQSFLSVLMLPTPMPHQQGLQQEHDG